MFPVVFLRFQHDNVALGRKNTQQKAEGGSQDGEDVNSHRVPPSRAHVHGDERDPHSEEDQHTEGDELGLVEVVREFPGQEGQEEAEGGQQADVSQNAPEADLRPHGTLQYDDGTEVGAVAVGVRGGGEEPDYTDQSLGRRAL